MLRIPCPFCGERDEDEFVYGADASRRRPVRPDEASDEQWTDYLYFANNTKGATVEWWWHTQGCTRWFTLTRDTVTHVIHNSDEGPT